jgi:hypothetical protein
MPSRCSSYETLNMEPVVGYTVPARTGQIVALTPVHDREAEPALGLGAQL